MNPRRPLGAEELGGVVRIGLVQGVAVIVLAAVAHDPVAVAHLLWHLRQKAFIVSPGALPHFRLVSSGSASLVALEEEWAPWQLVHSILAPVAA